MPNQARAVELETRITNWLQLGDATTPDGQALQLVAPAVEAWVDGLACIARTELGEWHPNVTLGAVMLGARLVRRRNSPGGIEAFTADGTAYVRNQDPDVATLLGLTSPRPKIG